jgi:hypothetical protein
MGGITLVAGVVVSVVGDVAVVARGHRQRGAVGAS